MLHLAFKMLCHLILEGIGVSSLLQACSAHSWERAESPGGGEGIQLGILLDMSFKFLDMYFFLQPKERETPFLWGSLEMKTYYVCMGLWADKPFDLLIHCNKASEQVY